LRPLVSLFSIGGELFCTRLYSHAGTLKAIWNFKEDGPMAPDASACTETRHAAEKIGASEASDAFLTEERHDEPDFAQRPGTTHIDEAEVRAGLCRGAVNRGIQR
jgi:hypothetical protein